MRDDFNIPHPADLIEEVTFHVKPTSSNSSMTYTFLGDVPKP